MESVDTRPTKKLKLTSPLDSSRSPNPERILEHINSTAHEDINFGEINLDFATEVHPKLTNSYGDLFIPEGNNNNNNNNNNNETQQGQISARQPKMEEAVNDQFLDQLIGDKDELPAMQTCSNALQQVRIELNKLENMIDEFYLKCRQENYPAPNTLDAMDKLIHNCKQLIYNTFSTEILHPVSIYYSYWLLQQLNICATRILLIRREIEYISGKKKSEKDAIDLLTCFIFNDMPLSQSFKNKNRARQVNAKKKAHCTMQASLLTSPRTTFFSKHSAIAEFNTKEDDSGNSERINLQNEVEQMKRGEVVTFNFRFPVGTRCKPAELKLSVDGVATLPGSSLKINHSIQSGPSHCYIVTTNECQWEGAEGKLLLFDLFGEKYISHEYKQTKKSGKKKKNSEGEIVVPKKKVEPTEPLKTVSWPLFINQLHIRFMRATRQETSINQLAKDMETKPIDQVFKRILTKNDIDYIHQFKFDTKDSVSAYDVEGFWEWYGKTLHVYRHNSQIRNIFLEYLFFSLVSKEHATQVLNGQSPGTFIIRTSERSKGEFAIACVTDENKVKHSKVEAKKILPPHNSLPDYLREKPQLSTLLKPIVKHGHYITISKDLAFATYYSSKDNNDGTDGYEEI